MAAALATRHIPRDFIKPPHCNKRVVQQFFTTSIMHNLGRVQEDMAKIEKKLADILTKFGEDPQTATWDCHGTRVMLHKALERIAAKAGIGFEAPVVIEANTADKIAVISVTGFTDDLSAWSIGEATPYNNKNSYPWAMAEKRAKDRVILKLIGLSGDVYSEEEADDFKQSRPNMGPRDDMTEKPAPGISKVSAEVSDCVSNFHACADGDTLLAYINDAKFKKFAFRVCCDYPSEWLGPEKNSGLSGCLAQVGENLKVDVQGYITKMEKARLERTKKGKAV